MNKSYFCYLKKKKSTASELTQHPFSMNKKTMQPRPDTANGSVTTRTQVWRKILAYTVGPQYSQIHLHTKTYL